MSAVSAFAPRLGGGEPEHAIAPASFIDRTPFVTPTDGDFEPFAAGPIEGRPRGTHAGADEPPRHDAAIAPHSAPAGTPSAPPPAGAVGSPPVRREPPTPEADPAPASPAPTPQARRRQAPARPTRRGRHAAAGRLRRPAAQPTTPPTPAPAAPLPAPTGSPALASRQAFDVLAVGPDEGGPPRVKLLDAQTLDERVRFLAGPTSYTGGVRVAVGDVNGDGNPDVLTGFGTGGGSRVRVFDGTTGDPFAGTLGGFDAFAPGVSDGTFVALGDFDADGRDDLVVGTDGDAAPAARVFSGLDGSLLAEYDLSALGSGGGARVAAGDVNGDGLADLIAAAGTGQRPRVRVHDGGNQALLYEFFAYEDSFFGGVYVAAGDLTGDGQADILTGPGAGRAPEVRAFHGADTAHLAHFLAYDASFASGVRVAAVAGADGLADIVTGQGPDGGRLRLFDGQTLQPLDRAAPYGRPFDDGLFVGGDSPIASGGVSLLSGGPTIGVHALTHPSEPNSTGAFRFTRSGGSGETPVVHYTIAGTASNGVDYQTLSGSFSFPPSGSFFNVTVNVLDDSVFEGTETVILTLQPGTDYTIGSPASATLSLSDNESNPNPTVPPPTVPSGGDDLIATQPGLPPASGGSEPCLPCFSEGPVRYFDGVVHIASSELGAAGFGTAWGQTLSWTNGPGYASGAGDNGNGWVVSQQPYLMEDGTTIIAVSNGTTSRYFDVGGSSDFLPRHFLQEELTYDSGSGLYTLTDTTGQVLTFHDFDTGLPAEQRGQLQSLTDPEGNVTEVVDRTTDGKVEEVQRESTVGGTTVIESYLYTYLTSGVNTGKISNVTLRRKVSSGSYTTVRQTDYTYYGTSESFGNLGDLKTEVVKDGGGTTLDTRYYRYHTSNSSIGYTGGLKFVFGHESFGRLAGAFVDPFAATDAQVDDYADLYLEYDAQHRVSKEIVQGAGCSACTGGLGSYTFAYGTSGFAAGYNSWQGKTIETLPDGNEKIVFTNYAGQVMLQVFRETATGDEWLTFYQYDSEGRLEWVAQPSAVSGYDESRPDLLDNQSGDYQYLRDDEGLIEVRAYGSSRTATSSTAGDVLGYHKETSLKCGEDGTAVLQSSVEYIERTAGGSTIYATAEETVYRNDNGTGAQTTSYAYTWFSGTVQMESMTATLPTISSGQNGPGSADTQTVYFDEFGRVIWNKDGAGFLSYTEYDQGTGAVTKSITDVDTTQTSDFSNLPSGWSTPSGGGTHQITLMEVDGLGRTTKLTDPIGNITYTVYDDDNHEVRTYRGWNTSTNTPTGPTEVYREDRAGSYTEMLTMSATPAHSGGRPTGAESIGSIQTLSRTYTNAAGQTTHSDAYFNLSGLTYSTSASLGTENTHFYRTRYGYENPRGWQDRVVLPTGTIQRTAYDSLGRVVSVWVGLDDTPTSGLWSPSNTAGTDLVTVSENVYDGGDIGDGNLTQTTAIPGGSEADRVTQHFYDWRNRPVATKAGVQGSEGTDTQRPIVYTEYDNLSQAIAREQYDGDNVSITDGNSDGVPDKPSSSLLRARSTTSYDDQGRVFQQKTFSVNESSGSVSSDALTTNIFYDHRSLVLKVSQPGGLISKMKYDGAGRAIVTYTTDGGGDSGWSDADDVTGDVVLEQTDTTFDDAGNALFVVTRQRFHDETATGELADPSTSPKARVSYQALYYDRANRLTDSVDVGTNAGSAYTRPSSVPSRSDTVLVTSQSYNVAGWVEDVTDPRGLITRTSYDVLGRTTKVVEAYTDGTVSDTDDKTVEYTYDGSGHMLTLKAYLTSSTYQKTEWVYGARTANGDGLNSNDLLVAMKYPDKSSGDPSNSEKESYTVNALGEVKTKTDRNNTVHTYTRDVLGRQTADAVTPGSGVDGAVKRLETAYDTAGRPYLFTSFDATSGGSIVNQVQREFNGLGQLITEYQAHSGAVNTSTSPKVQYANSEMASGANHSRLTSMTYPNGRVLNYNYTSGLDSTISRLSSLSDTSATLEIYDYLGLGTVVRRAHAQPGVDLTYVKQGAEANGDAGDQYTGLDRFGRVVDQRWIKTSDGSHLDRFKYGYDRDSNRLYRTNELNHAFDELYHADGASGGYDSLNQLTEFQRGTLSDTNSDNIPDTVATASRSQAWDFDALGNFESQTTDGTPESRTHNKQNQVTGVGSSTLTFDANGNMTTDEAGQQYVYDAWNRLVKVKDSGGSTIVTYAVDALGRRIVENPGTARDLFYSAGWQVLEEQVSGVAKVQHVWSPVYVDALVLRDRDADGSSGNGLEERLYALQDANYNVTGVVDGSGIVLERYAYDPYGNFTIYDPSWGVRSSSNYGWLYQHQGLRYLVTVTLYENRSRFFDPETGRFASVDPWGFGAGDTNLYRYEANSPHGHLDPLGLWAAEELLGDLRRCDGGLNIYNKAKQANGGKNPLIVPGPGAIHTGGSVKLETGAITLSGDLDVCGATQVLILELANLARKPDFTKLRDDCAAGKLSRDDFIRGWEKIEYQGVLDVIKAFDACKDTWACRVCHMEWARPAKDFDDYYKNFLRQQHKDAFGADWDRNCKAPYERQLWWQSFRQGVWAGSGWRFVPVVGTWQSLQESR